MCLQSINILHRMVSENHLGQSTCLRPPHPPTYLDIMGESNTCTALEEWGVKLEPLKILLLCPAYDLVFGKI